jgi:hypothetical protein
MPWRHIGEWRYSSTFLEGSALDRGEWSASRPCHFTPGERAPGTHWIGGWVGPRVGLDAVEKRKILHSWESNPGRAACSPSLYRLSYPNSLFHWCMITKVQWTVSEYWINNSIVQYIPLSCQVYFFPIQHCKPSELIFPYNFTIQSLLACCDHVLTMRYIFVLHII